MPFTLSHPAAVLPLAKPAKRFGVWSALVIGSVIPDLAYFTRYPRVMGGSHSALGLLTFCLPFGLAAFVVFELVLRKPLVFLFPESWRPSLEPARTERLPVSTMAALSAGAVLLGASSHVLWDLLTDPDGALLEHHSWVRYRLFVFGGYHLFVYRLLKHCGTLIGGIALWWAMRGWWRRLPASARHLTNPAERRRLAAVVAILSIPVAAGVYRATQGRFPPEWLQAFRVLLSRSVIWSGRIGGLTMCAYAIVWWVLYREFDRGDRVRARDL